MHRLQCSPPLKFFLKANLLFPWEHGTHVPTPRSVDKLLNRLSAKYTSDAYHVLRNNCNHFTDELCQALCGKTIPEWWVLDTQRSFSFCSTISLPSWYMRVLSFDITLALKYFALHVHVCVHDDVCNCSKNLQHTFLHQHIFPWAFHVKMRKKKWGQNELVRHHWFVLPPMHMFVKYIYSWLTFCALITDLCLHLCRVNRPAKMGSQALDALNAPFEAVSAVIKVFTPSKVNFTSNAKLCIMNLYIQTRHHTHYLYILIDSDFQ